MRHRGPDDCGVWHAPLAAFGHRRLSIIDLTPGGRQPMADPRQRVHIAFNGEIYNFRELRAELESGGAVFRTSSDTEVILQAYRWWGESFVERLGGMFALALFDEDLQTLFLARDRAGEKPLFCWRSSEGIVFASELKALFAWPEFPRRMRTDAVEHYFAYGYVPGDLCILEGVQKIRPGHIARYGADDGEWSDRAYWTLPKYADGSATAAELEQELEHLLEAAVRRQLVADVPVAILLSGGVDSSLVTAMAARARSHVKTFTVTFPSHPTHDEAPYARLVARHFGTDHTELEASDASPDLLARLARQYDEPMADSSMIPTYLVSAAIRPHATVALGGDGGDELFAGYPHYTYIQRLDRVRRMVPSPLRRAVSRAAKALPPGVRGRGYLMSLARDARDGLSSINLFFDQGQRRELLRIASPNGATSPEVYKVALAEGAHSLLDAAQRADFLSYMVDDILVKVDRASMLASLETRAPFLDPAVIELAFGRVPDSLKADLRQRKILPRRLASRLLPKELDLRRKQGFSIPLHEWFRGGWGTMMRDVLLSADPLLFNRAVIERLIRQQERGLVNAHRLFALTLFELWRREYHVAL